MTRFLEILDRECSDDELATIGAADAAIALTEILSEGRVLYVDYGEQPSGLLIAAETDYARDVLVCWQVQATRWHLDYGALRGCEWHEVGERAELTGPQVIAAARALSTRTVLDVEDAWDVIVEVAEGRATEVAA